jgi:hypothetical protein
MTQILYITSEYTDYLQDQILLGFKRTNEVTCIDYPKKDVLYQDCSIPDSELHGNGFTIWKTLREDEELNRNNIYDRLYNSEFDILIFGSIQRQADVFKRIDLNDIDCPVVFLDGEDKRYLPSFRESIPFVTEWLDRYKRGMGGRPQIGTLHRDRHRRHWVAAETASIQNSGNLLLSELAPRLLRQARLSY